ncbi:unnamed protein product [Withania somnifera]
MGSYGDEEKGKGLPDSPPNNLIFRYNSPLVQVGLIGLVCFCCPGMFNALSGMGGGGQVDHTAANNANTALYTTFAIFGILGGGIYNILGPQKTLLWVAWSIWVIGALADDSEVLSRYTGFYKGIQSAGGAVAWQVDSHNVLFVNQLIANWALTTISFSIIDKLL